MKKPPDFVYSVGRVYKGTASWREICYAPPHRPSEPGDDCNGCVWMIPGTYDDYAF